MRTEPWKGEFNLKELLVRGVEISRNPESGSRPEARIQSIRSNCSMNGFHASIGGDLEYTWAFIGLDYPCCSHPRQYEVTDKKASIVIRDTTLCTKYSVVSGMVSVTPSPVMPANSHRISPELAQASWVFLAGTRGMNNG